jgi:tetratricopeptide (TPR) repeat protein
MRREQLGLSFCDSKSGTGINDRSQPGWHCGNATRGNCKAQIIVNDWCSGGGPFGEDRASTAGGSPSAPPNDATEKSAAHSQLESHVSAKLSIGDTRSRELIPGEAALFHLKLTGLPDAALALGKAGNPWTQQISLKMLDTANGLVPLPASARVLGQPTQTDFRDPAPLEKPAPAQIKITPQNVYRVSLGIEGSEAAKLPAGELRIFATLNGEPLVSGSVNLKIRKPEDLSAEEQWRADSIRALSQARLAYAEGKFADAEKLAHAVIVKISNLEEAHLILARSLEEQNKLREAYDAYGKALEGQPPLSNPKVEELPLEIIYKFQELRGKLGIPLEPPPAAAANVLSAHALFAESEAEKINAPFPAKAGRIIFEWKLNASSAKPLVIRWIAADTNGAAPANYEIAASESAANAGEGRFTLKAPTDGFPPGKYRLDIWQSSKKIHTEEFVIGDK